MIVAKPRIVVQCPKSSCHDPADDALGVPVDQQAASTGSEDDRICANRGSMTMRDFFKGWRRKVGCVTLVMALACIGLWIRGYDVGDRITFDGRQAQNGESSSYVITASYHGIMGGTLSWMSLKRFFKSVTMELDGRLSCWAGCARSIRRSGILPTTGNVQH